MNIRRKCPTKKIVILLFMWVVPIYFFMEHNFYEAGSRAYQLINHQQYFVDNKELTQFTNASSLHATEDFLDIDLVQLTNITREQEECLVKLDFEGYLRDEMYNITSYCDNRLKLYQKMEEQPQLKDFKFTELNDWYFNFKSSRPRAKHPITHASKDGGGHDPRFNLEREHFQMHNCPHDQRLTVHELWPMLFDSGAKTVFNMRSLNAKPLPAVDDVSFVENMIIISRRDDHNPFYQLALAFNAWLIMLMYKWRPTETRLFVFDGGCPVCGREQPLLDLVKMIVSPEKPVIYAKQLFGRRVHFKTAVFSASEYSGPIQIDHNSKKSTIEECGQSRMIKQFKQFVLNKYQISSTSNRIMVTFIHRQNVSGRNLSRQLLNFDEVFAATAEYFESEKFINMQVQMVDYANMSSYRQQIQVTFDSHILIGMHGAGMVNDFWLPANATVVEIFPKQFNFVPYKNVCYFTGCKHFIFKGGSDSKAMCKTIPVEEWKMFLEKTFPNPDNVEDIRFL